MALEIVSFSKKDHDTSCFDCGEPILNRYLREQAGQDVRRHYAAMFVAVEAGLGSIKGYYTLSSASVSLHSLSEKERNKLPKYPDVPCVRLGRLAVDKTVQGQHIGVLLIADAAIRSLSNVAEWTAMLVDAKNDRAKVFYQKIGFVSLSDDPQRLFIMRTKLIDFVTAMEE